MKRNIRLYEYDPGLDKLFGPSDTYMSSVIPDLLEPRRFKVRSNDYGFVLPYGSNSNSMVGSHVILGDSVPECLFMDEEFRIESILTRLNPTISYFNHAYSGATSLDILNVVNNKIIPIRPAKIFFMAGVYDDAVSNVGFFSQDKRASSIVGTYSNVNLENYFFAHREILLTSIFSLLVNLGVELYVGTFGHRHNPLDPNHVFCNAKDFELNKYRKINLQTRSIAEKFGAYILDFESIMFDRFDLQYDNHHLTPAGSELIASHLRQSGF